MDLHLSVSDGFVSSGVCDRRDDFSFGVGVFHFWMAVFHVVLLVVCMSLGLWGLLGYVVVLMTLVLVINV